MPKFGSKSQSKVDELHPKLRKVLNEAIKHRDFTVLEGHRDEATQNHYFETGRSKLQWPDGKHNKMPSEAVDVAPWFPVKPNIRWNDIEAFRALGNFIIGVGAGMGVTIRWGGDWGMNLGLNWQYDDQSFHDLPHLELVD